MIMRAAASLRASVLAAALGALAGCAGESTDALQVRDFATRYTAAWCSHDPAAVASFFSVKKGSLQINEGAPAVGREAITAAAQAFMTAFPDLVVTMDDLSLDGHHAVYNWTLTGTNTGPGGTGRAVRISGYEEWTLGSDDLISESLGHFDEADYNRQLQGGVASAQ